MVESIKATDLEKYLEQIYLARTDDREPLIHFIEDENGNSLGRDMFNNLMKQAANSLISIDSFEIKNRGKVFVVNITEPLTRKELTKLYLNKTVAINHQFYEVIGIETPAVNKSFSLVGLLTKFKDDENK